MRDQRINTLTGTSLSDGSREQSSLPTAAMYAFDCQTIADGFRNDFCIVPPLTTRPREQWTLTNQLPPVVMVTRDTGRDQASVSQTGALLGWSKKATPSFIAEHACELEFATATALHLLNGKLVIIAFCSQLCVVVKSLYLTTAIYKDHFNIRIVFTTQGVWNVTSNGLLDLTLSLQYCTFI